MDINLNFAIYTQWSGYFTLACLLLTIIAFILGWGLRFRLFGVTSFMVVLTAGLFALNLGLFTRTSIPGAVRYSLVYDNGANQAVIVVNLPLTSQEAEATLLQAANDLFSRGRLGLSSNNFTVRLRTIVHPETGVSRPLYLGEARRSLTDLDGQNIKINLVSDLLKS
jgi:hypothetical protein